jgi:3-dehydroquinate synthetase
MELVDTLLSSITIAKTNESHSARSAIVVQQDSKADDEVRRKELLQLMRRHVQREVADIDVGGGVVGQFAKLCAERFL